MTDSEVPNSTKAQKARTHDICPPLHCNPIIFANFLLNSFLNFFEKYSIYSHILACMLEAAGPIFKALIPNLSFQPTDKLWLNDKIYFIFHLIVLFFFYFFLNFFILSHCHSCLVLALELFDSLPEDFIVKLLISILNTSY